MERIKKYTLFLMACLTAAMVVIVVAVAIFINSGTLNNLAKNRIVALFNKEYLSRIELKGVQFTFPDKVMLVAPRIFEEGRNEPALSADKVSAQFNFLSLLTPHLTTLSFKELRASGFRGNLTEQPGGRLNIEDLFTPRDPNKPQTIAIEKFRCRRISISNSAVHYTPYKGTPLDIREIQLDISKLSIGKKEIMGTVERLQCTMPEQQITLRKGSGMVMLTEKRSEILSLELETEKSTASLSVSLDGFDVFSGLSRGTISKSRVFLHVESIGLHTDELNRFMPTGRLPEGLYSLTGDAKGTIDDLQFMPTLLSHAENRLAFEGKVLNILDKDHLSFLFTVDRSKISSRFLEKLFDNSRQQEMVRQAGDIEFSGKVHGRIEQWGTDMAIRTGIGKGTLALLVTHENGNNRFRTEGSFSLEQATPQVLFGLDAATGSISCSGSLRAIINGRAGIETGHVEAALTNSFWQKQPLSSGTLMLDYTPGIFSTSLDLQGEEGSSLTFSGNLDLTPPVPSYQASGNMKKLDLSKALASREFTTSLNGSFELKGEGFDTDSLTIGARMLFSPSLINTFQIRDQSLISTNIKQVPSSLTIALKSDFVDLDIEGNSSLNNMFAAIQMAAAAIKKELPEDGEGGKRRAAAQEAASASAKKSMFPAVRKAIQARAKELPVQPSAPLKLRYRLTVHDPAPLMMLLPVGNLQMQASASGTASFSSGLLQASTDIGISTFRSGSGFTLSNTTMNTALQCTPAGVSSASLSVTAGSASIGAKEFSNIQITSAYANGLLDSSLSLSIPLLEEQLLAAFALQRTGSSSTIMVKKLLLSAPDGIWQATPGSVIETGATFTRFNRFLFGKGNQQIELDGTLGTMQPGTFQCRMTNIELGELKRFAIEPSLGALSGKASALFTVSGMAGAKTGTFDLRGTAIQYNSLLFGTLHLYAEHAGDRLRFETESHLDNADRQTASINTIKGSGTLPLILSYAPYQLRLHDNLPLQASFSSDNLSAQILEYLIPFFKDATGTIPTNLRITGTASKPELYLTTRLNDATVRIAPTQVAYRFSGELNATPSRLVINNLTMRDSLQGTGSISGLVHLDGLKPVSLDLSASCRNLLLFNKKDRKDDTSFGTMSGTTGNFLFYGSVESPTAAGELKVTSADFTIYRAGSNESAKYIGVEKFIEFAPRVPSRTAQRSSEHLQPRKAPEFHFSLIDILQISKLRLTCDLPLRYTMIFDRIRGEQLETAINNLSLNIGKSGQRYRLFGSVDIVGGKYRFSNSNFDLDSDGQIVWNNEEIRNGTLKNINGTKSVSASDAQSGERDNVRLLLAISGTINEPNVQMGYYLNEELQPYASRTLIGSQSSKIDSNAELNVISLLLSRQWYIHPSRPGSTGANPLSGAGVSVGTGMLSSQFSSILQGLAGIENLNVNLGSGSPGSLGNLELYLALTLPGTGGKVRFIGTGNTPATTKNSTAPSYYESSQKIEYRINPRLYIQAYRAYGQSGTDASSTWLQKPSESWGVSLSYREKFHNWNNFWNKLFGSPEKKP